MDRPFLPTLDAHAHLGFGVPTDELAKSGAVLAQTLSLQEAGKTGLFQGALVDRREPLVVWGVGCHPRKLAFQQAFDKERFHELARRTPLVGEVGLDSVYQVPLDLQIKTFRQVLEVVQDLPRLTSIHSYQTCQLLLDELTTRPIIAPVLHWWTGTTAETRQAVALGCYFSIHSQVARQSKWRTQVPLERVLVESDHGYNDPPPAIPHRVAWVEYLVAQQYRIGVEELRRVVWRNFARIVVQTGTLYLFPEELVAMVEANTV